MNILKLVGFFSCAVCEDIWLGEILQTTINIFRTGNSAARARAYCRQHGQSGRSAFAHQLLSTSRLLYPLSKRDRRSQFPRRHLSRQNRSGLRIWPRSMTASVGRHRTNWSLCSFKLGLLHGAQNWVTRLLYLRQKCLQKSKRATTKFAYSRARSWEK